ncbi:MULTISPECIES: hypothetical protein [unclassified Pedobacter]|nr:MULTISPECIES: hypothetical protein [unclassified Pedobacter]
MGNTIMPETNAPDVGLINTIISPPKHNQKSLSRNQSYQTTTVN